MAEAAAKASSEANQSTESCNKCVKVLRDLISGIQKDGKESRPLTLLKAIGGGNSDKVKIEPIDDGVKMTLPVQTTVPTLLRPWSSLIQQQEEQKRMNEGGEVFSHTLATSANATTSSNTNEDEDPLTIELKCRKCASSGPEGGARAFLMGPSPLSVVVCHNRIQSDEEEVQEILTHELTHLYDVQTLRMDLQQCENLAYSEVHAAKHAECRDSWKQLQKYCVKQKAICATNNLFPSEGRKCIQKVFDKAFEDNRPFDASTSHNRNATR